MRVNPANRQEAFTSLESARASLTEAISGLSPKQMTEPVVEDWSAKDLLAHIAAWDEVTLPDIERARRGHMPALAGFDINRVDEWNAMLMNMRRNFSHEQIVFELEDNRRRFVEALGGLSDSAFEPGFVLTICGIAATHDLDHADHVREWRSARGL